MDGKKVWAKVKEHRGEIFIATLTTVGVGAMAYFGIKKFSSIKISGQNNIDKLLEGASKSYEYSLEHPVIKCDHVSVTDLWNEGGFTNMIINDFTASDMGKVGEELMEHIPEIKPDTILSACLNTTTLVKSE